jgi:hypothetical protein
MAQEGDLCARPHRPHLPGRGRALDVVNGTEFGLSRLRVRTRPGPCRFGEPARFSVATRSKSDRANAYVRGNTLKFYEWLAASDSSKVPQGPPIWICGDCHVGNLGPLADTDGQIDIEIRDLDQTRLGQPDGISRSRMAEMLEVDKAGPKVRC